MIKEWVRDGWLVGSEACCTVINNAVWALVATICFPIVLFGRLIIFCDVRSKKARGEGKK